MNKEKIIARTDELEDGQMKTIQIDDEPDILLIRTGGRYYATDAYCPHYGAPMETGILTGGKIMCPWHHASFEVASGRLKDPPALTGLKTYQLEIRGNDIILQAENDQPQPEKQGSGKTFVIIGGGAAGNAAAQELRRQGFTGVIKMISADDHAPYDRTNLSKDFLQGDMDPDWLPLNPEAFYEKNGIELILGRKVTGIDTDKYRVRFSNDETMKYDRLLVASGGKPRKPKIPGIGLPNIFTLRSRDDAEKILSAAEGAREVVIIGASFIGMEAAENLTGEKRNIHVVAPEKTPFSHTLGEQVGTLIMDQKKKDGVNFHLGQKVKAFKGSGTVEEVVLENGDTITTDMVVLGMGIEPAGDFLPHFEKVKDGSLLTNKFMEVENDIFAAGDIATFPYWKTEQLIRVEHWRVAEQQGVAAARNMLGMRKPLEIIPFFWVNLAGLHMRYVGYAAGWDDTIIHGDLQEQNFIVYYINSGRVQAALGSGKDEEMALIEELLKNDRMPDAVKLRKRVFSASDMKKHV